MHVKNANGTAFVTTTKKTKLERKCCSTKEENCYIYQRRRR